MYCIEKWHTKCGLLKQNQEVWWHCGLYSPQRYLSLGSLASFVVRLFILPLLFF